MFWRQVRIPGYGRHHAPGRILAIAARIGRVDRPSCLAALTGHSKARTVNLNILVDVERRAIYLCRPFAARSSQTMPGPPRLPRSAAWPHASAPAAHRPRRRRPCRRMSSPSPAALVSASASGPLASNCSTTLAPAAFQLGQRHHLVHEADAAGIIRAKTLAGQRVAADLADADGVAELRDDDRRGQPPAHLGNREQRIVGRDHHVAGGDDAGAAAETAALHQRHRRNRQSCSAAAPLRRWPATPPRSLQAISAAPR